MTHRDLRFSRTIGRKPYSGHIYVLGGDVWIEYGAERKTLLVGENSKANRLKAEQILIAATEKARAIGEGTRPSGNIPVTELLAQYRADAERRPSPVTGQQIRPATLTLYRTYETWIAETFGQRTLMDVRPGEVVRWMATLRDRGHAQGVIARAADYFKSACRWAVSVELLPYSPIDRVKTPPRRGSKPVYKDDESQRLTTALLDLPIGRAWRFRLYVLMDAIYGVRAHQPLELTWSDVDFDRAFGVQLPGRAVQLAGTITFRQDALGSKGQRDRTVPMIPIIRASLLEAWNRRRPDSPWVFWNHRAPALASPYEAMNAGLKKLERAANVPHVKGRAFHALRRSLATALIQELGVAQASNWIADRPEVLLREYLLPTDQAQAQAADYLLNLWNSKAKLQVNSKQDGDERSALAASLELRGGYETGPAGLEPATPGFGDRCSTN